MRGLPWTMLAVVGVAALGIRGAALSQVPAAAPVTGDSVGYDDLAWRLVEGKGYTRSWAPETPYLRRPPGYPVWLAGVYSLAGHSPRAAQWAQVFLDAITAMMIAGLAFRWAGQGAGWVAGLLYAAYPPAVMFSTYLVSESLFTWLVTAMVWSLALASSTQRWRWWIAAGALLGAANLVKSVLLAFPIMLWLALWIGSRNPKAAWTRAAAVAAVSLAVALPWVVRNWRVSGRPMLAQEGLGWALWAGTLDPYSPTFTASEEPAWADDVIAPQIAGAVSMEEISHTLLPRAMQTITRDPAGYALLGVKKFVRLVTTPWGAARMSQHAEWLGRTYTAAHAVLILLAGFGVWMLSRRDARQAAPPARRGTSSAAMLVPPRSELLIVLGLIGYVAAFFSVLFVVPRYTVPLMPLVIALASAGFMKCLALVKVPGTSSATPVAG